MNKKKEMLFGMITLVLCVLLFAERLTGSILHAVLGVLLIVLMAVHMGGQMKKMPYRKAQIKVMDWVLILSLAVLFVSGMLLHPLQGVLALKIVHKLAAVIFVLGIIGHIVQHRRKSHVS